MNRKPGSRSPSSSSSAGSAISACTRRWRKSLDDRADRIKAELDEAARLKNEALALLAEYQRKRQEAEKRSAGDHRRRQGRSRAAGGRSQGQDRGIRRPPHQDGRDQDRPGRSPGHRRRPRRRRRCRRCRRREDPDPASQGSSWPATCRQGHRRRPQEAELARPNCRLFPRLLARVRRHSHMPAQRRCIARHPRRRLFFLRQLIRPHC